MLLDVLSDLKELKICTAYEIGGQQTHIFPSHVDDLRHAKPIFETLPGWQTDIRHVKQLEDLPQKPVTTLNLSACACAVPSRMYR